MGEPARNLQNGSGGVTETTNEVGRVLHLREFFLRHNPSANESFLRDSAIAPYLDSSAVRGIHRKLWKDANEGSRRTYLVEFVEELEGKADQLEIRPLYEGIRHYEERHHLNHPLGIGILADYYFRLERV